MFWCGNKLGDYIRNLELWLYLGTATWELEHESETEVNFTLDIVFKKF